MTALAGKVAVVTGASRGIGFAVSRTLEAAGAHVIRLARTLTYMQTSRRTDIPCDVAQQDAVAEAVDRIVAEHGTPDVVVNNAGAFMLKPLTETTGEELQRQLAVNLVGPFLVVRALLPHFLAQRRGHIVTIGSIADYQPLPGNAAYGASKYGLRGLHEIMAAEIVGRGVRTTLISPGPTDTSLWDPLDPDRRDDLPNRARMQTAEDVAEAVLFAVTRSPTTNVELIRMMPA